MISASFNHHTSPQDTNWARKKEHTEAGQLLQTLEGQWLELVGKNYSVERACGELEIDVERLEKMKQERLCAVLPDSSTMATEGDLTAPGVPGE